MAIAHSKITAQSQITVPAEVRRKLGVGPGSTLEWEEADGGVFVRRAGRVGTAEVHAALFGKRPLSGTSSTSVEDGIRRYIRAKHARD